MCDIVWVSPQEHWSESESFHFFLQARLSVTPKNVGWWSYLIRWPFSHTDRYWRWHCADGNWWRWWSTFSLWAYLYKKLIRRWDSERELSLRRHCTRSKNTIDSCINSATDRFLQHRFTKFSEITQCNGHYAVQGHSRSPILVPIESSYMTSY